MNRIIKEQLGLVKAVDIEYTDEDLVIHIPKSTVIPSSLVEVDHIYHIRLLNNIDEKGLTSYLMSNYNKGRHPKEREYSAEVLQIVGNMVHFNMRGNKDVFDGWLPTDTFKVIQEEIW